MEQLRAERQVVEAVTGTSALAQDHASVIRTQRQRESDVAQGPQNFSEIHVVFFFSSRRRHTRFDCDWSSDVCSSDLAASNAAAHSVCGRSWPTVTPREPHASSEKPEGLMTKRRPFCPRRARAFQSLKIGRASGRGRV